MPAAAVIPAPLVYTNAVAVKKLVVGFRAPVVGECGSLLFARSMPVSF